MLQPLFPLSKDYFHQNNIHLEIIHCILSKGEFSYHFNQVMIFQLGLILVPPALYRNGIRTKGRRPKVTYPSNCPIPSSMGLTLHYTNHAHKVESYQIKQFTSVCKIISNCCPKFGRLEKNKRANL